MLTQSDFRVLLERRGTLVIDGALATELEARGHDLNHALWSANLLQNNPNSIQQVHLDYYLAGADVAITASYQASTQGLSEHLGLAEEEAKELIKRSVRIAQRARCQVYQQLTGVSERKEDETPRQLLIAGSVGPYGAYLADGSEYRGDYLRTPDEFKSFHRPRIQALVDACVDLLAIETIPSMPEIEAICSLLRDEFSNATAWVSCTLRDAEHLSDGTPLAKVLTLVSQQEHLVAFGINCVPVQLVSPWLQHMGSISKTLSKTPNLLCYPNSGEIYDADSKTWNGPKPVGHTLGNQARKWNAAGAKLIGGCCRTCPADIEGIALKIHAR